MTQDKIRQIHRIYGWVLAAVLTVLGILCILSCLDIYTSGPRPYCAEAIAQRFDRIRIAVFIGIFGIIGGIGLNLLLPCQPKRSKGVVSPQEVMLRLRRKVSIAPVQKEIRLRCILRAVTATLFVVLMIYPAIYLLLIGQFTVSYLNADVIRAVGVSFVPAAIGLILCWICQRLVNASYRRETAIYKQALADGHRTPLNQQNELPAKCSCNMIPGVKITIIVIAVVFIIIGIFNGGAEDVLKKAIAICTECIGLG